ncbi:MCD, Malonyl-CoA decarboxylase MCD (plasmid) [Neorhizobium sp. SOG26]|uniref:malonyl-CoA decarboxylase n=1 Tax=Neorhizobium sp. SOG26 TaxID=2060726 RepID=UPI000E57D0F2|nr:malonyl-CoA decarboxylase [Neorhizobium sp. SOG26]AXV18226.1 MCD, Malonyl-CoA decarboxylase MCD [Neorhizobium sp. SOG26]
MNSAPFLLSDMLQAIADKGRRFLSLAPRETDDPIATVSALCDTLLSSRGEASGMALAQDILNRWQGFSREQQRDFMVMLLERFGPDVQRLERAISAYKADPNPEILLELHLAAEPRRQELIRRLNLAPQGIRTLVRMREVLLGLREENPDLAAVDADFAHLFGSWFNRGFLLLRPIDWSTPANILEKIIRYEAVHDIGGWDELRRRLEPDDRRCFAFFHPQLSDDPLIFVEVALTREIPSNIDELLREDRPVLGAEDATTAVFYSISNCQNGLRGVSFGNFLIKQVVEDLRRDHPKLQTFVTLSPVPGFAGWLARERGNEASEVLSQTTRELLGLLDQPGWENDGQAREQLEAPLKTAAAWYFLRARNSKGRAIDPVARFHLGNGARLERLNVLGDSSPRAMRQAHGLMVNYLYKLDEIEANHEAFVGRGEVVTTPAIRRLVPAEKSGRPLIPTMLAPIGAADETKQVNAGEPRP